MYQKTNKEFLLHFFDELNLINWLIVLVCIFATFFVDDENAEFVKNIALTSLPTGVVLRHGNKQNQ